MANSRLAILVSTLAEAFRQTSSDAMMLAYDIGLRDLPLADIERAVMTAIRDSKFMPTVSELRRLAGVKTAESRAILAWNIVLDTVPIGSYKHVDFEDKAINAAIRSMGGWPALLDRSGDDFYVWARKAFIEAYETFSRHRDASDERPLAGLSEAMVRGGRIVPPEPIKIGCAATMPAKRIAATATAKGIGHG